MLPVRRPCSCSSRVVEVEELGGVIGCVLQPPTAAAGPLHVLREPPPRVVLPSAAWAVGAEGPRCNGAPLAVGVAPMVGPGSVVGEVAPHSAQGQAAGCPPCGSPAPMRGHVLLLRLMLLLLCVRWLLLVVVLLGW